MTGLVHIDCVTQLAGVADIPQGHIRIHAWCQQAFIAKAQCQRAIACCAAQCLLRRQAKQNRRLVLCQLQRSDRRGTGVKVGGYRHWNMLFTQRRHRRFLLFIEEIVRTGEQHGNAA
jgi:hypothetical protein